MKPTIDIEADASSQATTSPADLKQVSELCERALLLETRIAEQEEVLKELKEQQTTLITQSIPEAMDSCGLKNFVLSNGASVTVKPIIVASIPSEGAIAKAKDELLRDTMRARLGKALSELEAAGAGALIKSELSVLLGKGQEQKLQHAATLLKSLGLEPDISKTVNSNSLSSWARERIAAGLPVDYETFGIYDGRKAIIKPAK